MLLILKTVTEEKSRLIISFIVDREIMKPTNKLKYERKLPKENKELFNSLKGFLRFMTNEEFEEMFEGMVLEKSIKQRLNQLYKYRQLGMRTYAEIEKTHFSRNDLVNHFENNSLERTSRSKEKAKSANH